MIDKMDSFSSRDDMVYEVSCDSRSFSEEIEAFNFPCLIEKMRQRRWKSFKIDDEWTHKYWDCQAHDRERQAKK